MVGRRTHTLKTASPLTIAPQWVVVQSLYSLRFPLAEHVFATLLEKMICQRVSFCGVATNNQEVQQSP